MASCDAAKRSPHSLVGKMRLLDEHLGTSKRDGLKTEPRTANGWDGRRTSEWRLEAVMLGDG